MHQCILRLNIIGGTLPHCPEQHFAVLNYWDEGVGDPCPSAYFAGVGLEGLSLESEPPHDSSGLVASLPDGRSIVSTAIDTDPTVVGVDMPEGMCIFQ